MHKSHTQSFQRLESSKKELLNRLAVSDPKLIANRKNGKWSPLEQCYHLYLAEMLSRKYCVKKLSFNPDLKNAGLKSQWRLFALKVIELVPLKFKAPVTVGEQVFPDNLNLEMLRLEWDKERKELKVFLDNLEPALVYKEIYKQPTVGRLTIGGMLEFFQFHLDRHRNHIRRDYGIK